MKVVIKVSRRSNRVEVVQKKVCTEVSRRKERTTVVCERKSPEDQNRAGRGSFLRKGERTSSWKGQKSAESRALRLLAAVEATGVPVAPEL